jgi:hypothetical protein
MRKTINFVLSAVLTGMLLNAGIVSAHSDDDGDRGGYHKGVHKKRHHKPRTEARLLEPRSLPYALPTNAGPVDVTFNVRLINAGDNNPQYVFLLEKDGSDNCDSRHDYCKNGGHNDNAEVYKLNDQGQNGDAIADDGVYSATVKVTTSHRGGHHKGQDRCVEYGAFAVVGRNKLKSPDYSLCRSSLPLTIAESNTKPENLVITEKEVDPAVGDELLVRFDDNASEQQILAVAKALGAQVVGSVLPRGLYQLRFPRTLSAQQLSAAIRTLESRSGVQSAYVNRVGTFSSLPDDTEYLAGNQHGYTWINADDAWNIGADGEGVTVAVLDSGIAAHGDLPIASTDTVNHGTPMAGIIGALTNNANDVAGVAGHSTLQTTTLSPDSAVTIAEMVAGFEAVAAAGTAQVVAAGFNITMAPPNSNLAVDDQWDLCSAINDVVLNGATPVAVVVSAAGNNNSNGFHYPSKCNDSSAAANSRLTNKNLLITVMGSVTCTSGCTPDTRQSNSNYGAWIDVAAPAVNIRSTNNVGGEAYFSGTSYAAALVAGTAAQMLSCGATPSQIQSRLTSTAPVNVPHSGGSKPRIDAYQAVLAGNTAPTGVSLSGDTSIDEETNTGEGYVVGSLSPTDANVCDAFSYSIQGGTDSASFSIGGPDMDQLVLTAGVLDFETQSSYSVTVRVTDVDGLTFDQPFIITVNDLVENTAPVVNEQSFNIDENSENGSSVGTVVASDGEGDTLSFSITGGNTSGAFAIGSTNGAITVNNSQALDFETTPSFALTVEVSDGVLSGTTTITVNLNDADENTAPVIEDQVFAVDENSIKGTLVGVLAASDGNGDTLSFSITAGNDSGAFNINSDGAITVANDAPLDFERTPSFALTVEVSDGVLTDTATVTVNLNDMEEQIIN